MAGTTPLIKFRYHANQLLIVLRNCSEYNANYGMSEHLIGLANASKELVIPVPVEAVDISYGDKLNSGQHTYPVMGSYVIVFPDGKVSGGTANAHGWELLIESRNEVIVAIEQWLAHLEYSDQNKANESRTHHRTQNGT